MTDDARDRVFGTPSTAPTSNRLGTAFDTLRHEDDKMNPTIDELQEQLQATRDLLKQVTVDRDRYADLTGQLESRCEELCAEAASVREAAARVAEENTSWAGCDCTRTHVEAIRALDPGPVAREYMERLELAESKVRLWEAADGHHLAKCADEKADLKQRLERAEAKGAAFNQSKEPDEDTRFCERCGDALQWQLGCFGCGDHGLSEDNADCVLPGPRLR